MCHSRGFFAEGQGGGGVVGGGVPVNVSELKRGRYQNTPFPALGLEANTKKMPQTESIFYSLEDL